MDSKERRTYSVREIRALFQKPFHQEEPYAWLVTRRMSVLLTYFLQRTTIRPNAVTASALAIGVISGGLLISASPGLQILAVVGIQLWYVLDCVDGELARLTRQFSNLGIFLDYLMHYLVDAAVLTGIAIRTVRYEWDHRWSMLLIFGTAAVLLNRILNDLPFRLVVESQQGFNPVTASRSPRNYTSLVNKVVGVYPRPGYVWHSVPMYLAVSGAIALDVFLKTGMVVHVAGLYSLVHLISLGVRVVGIVSTGRVESGRWVVELEKVRE